MKTQHSQKQINKQNYYFFKDTIKGLKKQAVNWEEMFAHHIPDKRQYLANAQEFWKQQIF